MIIILITQCFNIIIITAPTSKLLSRASQWRQCQDRGAEWARCCRRRGCPSRSGAPTCWSPGPRRTGPGEQFPDEDMVGNCPSRWSVYLSSALCVVYQHHFNQRDGCTQQCSTFEDSASQCFPQLPPEAQEHSRPSQEEFQAPVIRQYEDNDNENGIRHHGVNGNNKNGDNGDACTEDLKNVKSWNNVLTCSIWLSRPTTGTEKWIIMTKIKKKMMIKFMTSMLTKMTWLPRPTTRRKTRFSSSSPPTDWATGPPWGLTFCKLAFYLFQHCAGLHRSDAWDKLQSRKQVGGPGGT